MKQLIGILAIACLLFANQTYAQDVKLTNGKKKEKVRKKGVVRELPKEDKSNWRTAGERAGEMTVKLAEKLYLTDQQKQKVLQINTTTLERVDNLRANRVEKISTFKRDLKKAYADREVALKSVLTYQQFLNYEKYKKEMKNYRKGTIDR